MHKELSYLNSEGFTVFTSQFHKNRGNCCKSACLHCPYGYTLKKLGLEFAPVTDPSEVEDIMTSSGKERIEWQSFLPDNALLVKIKGQVCGVVFKNHIVIKHFYLKSHFQDQGLSKEMLESYLFI